MYNKFFCHLIFIIFLIVGCAVRGDENARQLADFESLENNKLWLNIKPPRKDCRNAEISISKQFRSHGKNSLKVEFTKHQSGMRPYFVLIPSIDNRALKITDWTLYHRLVVDVYNPSIEAVSLYLSICDTEYNRKFKRRYILSSKWNKIIIPMRYLAKKKINLAKIAELSLYVVRPRENITLYIDNFLLSKESGTPWNLAASGFKNSVMKLKSLQNALRNDIDKAIKINNDLKLKKGNYQTLLSALNSILENLCNNSIAAVESLGIPESEKSGVKSSSLNYKRQIKITNLELFSDKINIALAEKKLLNLLDQNNSNPDFAVGQIKFPDINNIRYFPRTYAGPLIDTVSISACKNATESFCLLVIPKIKALKKLQLRASNFKNNSGQSIISADNIQISPLAYRMDHFKNAAFAYLLRPDISKVNIPANTQQAFWVNVKVPENTMAGNFFGNITISADGIKSQKIDVNLKVYNFVLPKTPSLPLLIHSNSRKVDADALDVMAHHCEAGSIYEPRPPTIKQIEFWSRNGAQMINLLRISRMGRGIWKLDKNGKKIDFSESKRRYIFKKLRRIVSQVKGKGLLDKCFVYGFDEPSVEMLPVMEKIYGEIKKEFGLKTMFTTYKPLWEDKKYIKNVDYWGVVWFLLTPEVIAKLKKQNVKIWAYNLATGGPQARLQFWSAFKSGMDGLLHYKLNSSNDISPKTAFPVVEAKLGGVRMPDVAGRKNYNTIGFEMWREGSEDYEYLCLLRKNIKRLEKNPSLAKKNAELLFKAKAILFLVNETIPAINKVRNSSLSLKTMCVLKEKIAKIIEKLEYVLKQT